jgi:hypothetical protein
MAVVRKLSYGDEEANCRVNCALLNCILGNQGAVKDGFWWHMGPFCSVNRPRTSRALHRRGWKTS